MRVYEQALRKGVELIDKEVDKLHLEIKDLEREREQLARLLKGVPTAPVLETESCPPDVLALRAKNLRKYIDADLPPELREVEYGPDDAILDEDETEDDESLEEEFSFEGMDDFREAVFHTPSKHNGHYPRLSSGSSIQDIYGDSTMTPIFPDPDSYGMKRNDPEMEI